MPKQSTDKSLPRMTKTFETNNVGISEVRQSQATCTDEPHVMFIIDRFTNPQAGAEGALLRMTEMLPSRGVRCSVVTFADPDTVSTIIHPPCALYVLEMDRTWSIRGLRAAARLARIMRDQRVDIVHTFFESSDIWGGAIARMSGVPIIVSSRRDMGVQRSGKHDFAYRLTGQFYDQVLTVSDQVKQMCISRDRFPRNRIRTVYNGIDASVFCPVVDRAAIRRRLGLPEYQKIVTTVGNVRYIKGTDEYVRVAAEVAGRLPGVQFIHIGGDNEPEFHAQVNELVLRLNIRDKVRFIGASSDVASYLQATDVFTLLSRSEGFSNALIEAMACSLPCVVTRVGGNDEAITNSLNGFIIEFGETRAAAERITQLLLDPSLSSAIGTAARKEVLSRFTTTIMVGHLVDVYRSLLATKKAQN